MKYNADEGFGCVVLECEEVSLVLSEMFGIIMSTL